MKLQSTLRDHAGFLYLAPLINVMLLLLLFFLLSSSFVLRSGISVDTPTSTGSLPPIENAHVITVTRGAAPRVFFNEDEVGLDGLAEAIATAKVGSPNVRHVVIRGDAMSPYGVIIQISDLVKQQKMELALATIAE
ncbi:MAG: biopolymer transporter ExbD [Verrucomicrobiota bacterium]